MANTENHPRPGFLRRWLAVPPSASAAGAASPDAVAHSDIQFEATDVSSRRVVLAGVGLLLTVWIVVLLLHFVFDAYANHRAAVSPPAAPLAAEQNRVPPAPQLQVSPREDIQQLRAYETSMLTHYTWADRKNGIVEIPIQQAMQLLAARGIPPQKAPADLKLAAPTAGTRMTGFEGKVEPEPR